MFITFEGIDGSGKSLQARRIADWLNGQGKPTVLTREPGGSAGAEEIRDLLLRGDKDRWSAETELLLFTAARRDHLERVIQRGLDEDKIVISDRFADSTRVYQGVTRGDLRPKVDALHDLMIQMEPDITFLIDIAPHTALGRAQARGDDEQRFESFGLAWQEKLRIGFLKLAQSAAHRIILIDGDQSPDAITAEVQDHLTARL